MWECEKMEKQQFLSRLKQNYERVSNFFGYEIATSIRIPLAVQYTFSRETFSGIHYENTLKKLQKETPKQTFMQFISNVSNKSILSAKIETYLVLHENPQQEIERLVKNEKILEKAGFKNSSYQNIAAIFLQDEAHAKRAKVLHEEMRKYHYFLTGKDDIPYAVLLTKDGTNIQVQAQTMRIYYDKLAKRGFKSGQNLQAMSQLLTLYNEQFQPVIANYVAAIKVALEEKQIHVKKSHYTYLALLALTGTNEELIGEIVQLTELFLTSEPFITDKVYALMTAIHYIIHEQVEAQQIMQLTELGLLLQAMELSDFLLDFTINFSFDLFDFFT